MFAWKSFFYSAYVALAVIITLVSVAMILGGEWLWSGVLLAWLPLHIINLWRRFRAPLLVEDEREHLAMALALVGLGMLLIGGERSWPLAIGGAGVAALLMYRFFWTSVKQGLRAEAEDTAVMSELADGTQPVLVIFLRGDWCPYSHMVMRDTEAFYQSVTDSQSLQLRYISRQTWGGPEMETLLVDQDEKYAAALGLRLRGGVPWLSRMAKGRSKDCLAPALALLSPQGECLFWERATNYRLPPTPRNRWSKIQARLKTLVSPS